MKAPLLPLLLTTACLTCGPDPDFVTAFGVAVYHAHPPIFVSLEQADAMESYLVEHLLDVPGYSEKAIRECMRQAVVYVRDEETFTCTVGVKCSGEQDGFRLTISRSGCAKASAYVHEEAHWLQQCVRNEYDPDHRDQAVWDIVNGRDSVCDPE